MVGLIHQCVQQLSSLLYNIATRHKGLHWHPPVQGNREGKFWCCAHGDMAGDSSCGESHPHPCWTVIKSIEGSSCHQVKTLSLMHGASTVLSLESLYHSSWQGTQSCQHTLYSWGNIRWHKCDTDHQLCHGWQLTYTNFCWWLPSGKSTPFVMLFWLLLEHYQVRVCMFKLNTFLVLVTT